MKKLSKHSSTAVAVHPRWPYRYVFVSDEAYEALRAAQLNLNDRNITLVLTRGLENEGPLRMWLHTIARRSGAALFWLVFPTRRREISDIFSSNGHTVSADCVDIAIVASGKRLTLLPLGVFTPESLIGVLYRKHRDTIEAVRATLRACGFSLHTNATESMQIHCELGDTLGKWRHGA